MDPVVCYFCGIVVSREEAIEAGWVPLFRVVTEERETGPACPGCVGTHLRFNAESEDWELTDDRAMRVTRN